MTEDSQPPAALDDAVARRRRQRQRWQAEGERPLGHNLVMIGFLGWVIVTPLMLVGWWRRRRDRFLLPFGLYALGLHLAMTFVFPFPGYRGGLLHSAAALIPFWAALGVAGLDDIVEWVARRRRRWNARGRC